MTKKSLKDPTSNKTVRFTDNSAKEHESEPDFYPKDQSTKPLMLDPVGAPYSQMGELTGLDFGDSEESDEEWAMMVALSDELDSMEENALEAHMLIEDEAVAGDLNDDR